MKRGKVEAVAHVSHKRGLLSHFYSLHCDFRSISLHQNHSDLL